MADKKLTPKDIFCYGFLGVLVIASCAVFMSRDSETEESTSDATSATQTLSPENKRLLDLRNEIVAKKERESDRLEFDSQGRVVGAFGYKLGDTYNDVSTARNIGIDGLLVSVSPKNGKDIEWFDSYLLVLTPLTHRIAHIVAGRSKLGPWNGLDGGWERTAIKMLAQDWLFVRGCKMSSFEDADGDRHLDGMLANWFAPELREKTVMMVFTWKSSEFKQFGIAAGVHFFDLGMTAAAANEYGEVLDAKVK